MARYHFNKIKAMWQYLIFRFARIFLNGNAAKLENALNETRRLKRSLEEFDRVRRDNPQTAEACDKFYGEWLELAEKVEDELGNLLTIIFGFSHLHAQISEVKRWYDDEDNVKRLTKDD